MPQYNLQLQDVKSLREYAKELGREQSRLEMIIEGLNQDNIESLEVRNNTIAVRGLGYVAKFVDAVREAHLAIRMEQGTFTAEAPRKSKAAKKKSK